MNKKKNILVMSWFYCLGSLLALGALIVLLICVIVDIKNPTLTFTAKIVLFTFVPISFILLFIIFGVCFIQWITLDNEKIVARNLFKAIREIKWGEIEEIKMVSIGYTPFHPKYKWLLIIDSGKGEIYLNSPFNWAGRYIKIRNTNKIRSLIKKYRADINIAY